MSLPAACTPAHLRLPGVCLAAFCLIAGPALAGNVRHDHTERTYAVTSTTLAAITSEMNRNGPRGYWAYAEWYVQWSGSCDVVLTTTVTFPELASPNRLSAAEKASWDRMVTALRKHEMGHVDHGRAAAKEIAADCRNGDAIIRKYNAMDLQYDRVTDHGRRDGVRFD